MIIFRQAALLSAFVFVSTVSQAEIFWSNIGLTYLNGSNYQNPFADKASGGQVYTLEHAGAYHFGKSFFFVDRFHSGDKSINNDETYMELGVDISLSWLANESFDTALIKDVYLVTQWENANPEGQTPSGDDIESTDNLLLGAGIRWKAPGFTFLDTNLYYRLNENDQENFQLTTAWSLPFALGAAKLVFDGFFDWTTPTENIKAGYDVEMTFHAQPQLKLDLGHFFDQSGQYYLGVELDYWVNKFGVDDQDQTAPQLLVQVNF